MGWVHLEVCQDCEVFNRKWHISVRGQQDVTNE